MSECPIRLTPVHKLVENDWALITDEGKKTRIFAVINNELCWRYDGRPGEWHCIRTPLTYNPRQRLLSAIGLRPVTLSTVSTELQREQARVSDLLMSLQMCSKTDSWFTHRAGNVQDKMKAAQEAAANLKKISQKEVEGRELSLHLRKLAAFADKLNMQHSLLVTATVTRDTTLHVNSKAMAKRRIRAAERAVVLALDGKLPKVLVLHSAEYPCFDGEYTLVEKTEETRPVWQRGAVVIYAKSGGWAIGWEHDMKGGNAYLHMRGKTPYHANKWQRSNGLGGWTAAPRTCVKVHGTEAPQALVDINGKIGYVKMSHLLLDTPLQPQGTLLSLSPPPPKVTPVPFAAALAILATVVAARREKRCSGRKRPLDWIIAVSRKKKTGVTFYYNKVTKQKQWHPPPELVQFS